LRTPNMEGPTPNSSLYVTLAHEYGFCGSNLKSLLDICGFDDITFHDASLHNATLKQRIGALVRWPFLQQSRLRHRLFGVNEGGQFGSELIVTARRGNMPALFDTKYRGIEGRVSSRTPDANSPRLMRTVVDTFPRASGEDLARSMQGCVRLRAGEPPGSRWHRRAGQFRPRKPVRPTADSSARHWAAGDERAGDSSRILLRNRGRPR